MRAIDRVRCGGQGPSWRCDDAANIATLQTGEMAMMLAMDADKYAKMAMAEYMKAKAASEAAAAATMASAAGAELANAEAAQAAAEAAAKMAGEKAMKATESCQDGTP